MGNKAHTERLYQNFKEAGFLVTSAYILGFLILTGIAFLVGSSPVILLKALPESWLFFCKYPLTIIAFILSAVTIFFLSNFVLDFLLFRGKNEKEGILRNIAYSTKKIEELQDIQRKIEDLGICHDTQRKIFRREKEIENTREVIQKEQQKEGSV